MEKEVDCLDSLTFLLSFEEQNWFLMSSALVEKVSLEKRVDLSNVP